MFLVPQPPSVVPIIPPSLRRAKNASKQGWLQLRRHTRGVRSHSFHLRSNVPCLQASLYRLLRVVYQIHRTLIKGCPCGLGNQGSYKD